MMGPDRERVVAGGLRQGLVSEMKGLEKKKSTWIRG
jgi:hypothetical protein